MCGLAGWTLKDIPTKEERKTLAEILKVLAEAAAMRGTDSHGMGQILFDGALVTYRGLGTIEKVTYRIPLSSAIMLHTRAKTVGSINVRNAHPFSMEGILGAHNGVVANHRTLETEDKRKYTVDSQALIARIGKGEDGADVDAWGAVTWINEEAPEKGIYMAQLPSGTLEIGGGTLPEGTPISLWASVIPTRLMEKLVKDYTEYHVEKQQVYNSVGGNIFVTERKLAVGKSPRRWSSSSSSYQGNYGYSRSSTDFKQGPNGEIFKADEPCKCKHTFAQHSVYLMYGGICKPMGCQCKQFDPEIGVEAADQSKKLATVTNKAKETKAERRARIANSPACDEKGCAHPRVKHKKGRGICWEKACMCRKYVLAPEKATSTVYEVPKDVPLNKMCLCGHQNMSHKHMTQYQNMVPISVDRSCMAVNCECESFELQPETKKGGGTGSVQQTFPEKARDTQPVPQSVSSKGSSEVQVAKESSPVGDVGTTLAKLGEEAAKATMRPKPTCGVVGCTSPTCLTEPCQADICKGNGKCLSTVCPSRRGTRIAQVVDIHAGYNPNRE